MPSHSTVESEAIMSIDGFVVSSIVNVAVVVLALPQSSVAVKITVADPVAAVVQGNESLLQVTPSQTSEAVRHRCWRSRSTPSDARAVALNC